MALHKINGCVNKQMEGAKTKKVLRCLKIKDSQNISKTYYVLKFEIEKIDK